MAYSKSLNLEQLYSCAKRHALYYFNEVIKSDDFLQSNVNDLVEYLSSPHLNITCEVEILDAIMRWYNFDKSDRKAQLKECLPCFHGEDVHVLVDNWEFVKNHELMRECEEWQEYIDNINKKDDNVNRSDDNVNTSDDRAKNKEKVSCIF
jgi:hypothetical protein